VLGFISIIGYLRRIERKYDRLLVEHEMLIFWMCETKGIHVSTLPTRSGGIKS
jgi:hypothetical protein